MKTIIRTPELKYRDERTNFIQWRFLFIYGCISLSLMFLLGRITWLQVISSDVLIHQGDMRSLRVQEIFSSRGMITDRFGYPLALNVPVKTIWIDPKELHNTNSVSLDNLWKALSNVLKIPFDQVIARVNSNPKRRFVYLARQINTDIANYISKLKLPGIHLRDEFRRYYPSGEVTSHLIGFTDIDGHGIEGIEKSFDKWLSGRSGERVIRKDRYNQVIEDISFTESESANDLVLSIDKRLQTLIYHELNHAVSFNKAESGSAVLLDINTGEVLAMVNSPSYNPNNLNHLMKDVIRNRAITDMFEPGSTVKPMVIMTALQCGIVKENSILNTIPYRIKGHEIKDVIRYDELTLAGILQKSSNVGVSKLALAMPFSALLNTYSSFGLGKSTNLGLIGERSGLYPQRKRWSLTDRITFSFGYGLMVTPLQLARVYATIGSYGIYRPLSVIKVNPPISGKHVFPESIIRSVIHMMESVALPGGSGAKAAIKNYRIAIKTGTVKKVGPDGHYINKYIAYTAGIAPASNPRFALVVVINNPQAGKYYGGSVSAPAFGTIMSNVLRTMNIVPDR